MHSRFGMRGRRAGSAATVLFLLCAAAPAHGHDGLPIDRVTMGRTTYPQGSYVLQFFGDYFAQDLAQPRADMLETAWVLQHGLSDRLTAGIDLETRVQRRDRFEPEFLGILAGYRVLDRPGQLALFGSLLPSLKGGAARGRFGAEGLKNLNSWSFFFLCGGEIEEERKEGESETELEVEIEPGTFYRFGLHGVAGLEWEVLPRSGEQSLDFVLGGSVSKNLFLAIEPKLGITSGSPDLRLRIQVQLYSGPYGLGGWGLD